MPDVDEEWAKFEREVIGQPTASRKSLYWGIGIAASIALLAGIFLFGNDTEEMLAEKTVAEQMAQYEELQTPPLTPPLEGRGVSAQNNITAPLEGRRAAAQNNTKSDLLAQAAPLTTEKTVYDCGEVMPQYPGGDRALKEFIKTNLKYPDLAMEYGARGRVIMNFLVDSAGYVSNIKPLKYLLKYDTLCINRLPAERQVALKEQIKTLVGEEGIRILSLMTQRWTPGSLFGKNRSMRYSVPIIFNATDAERQTYLAQRDEALQDRIAGLNIVPTSADLGPNAIRLTGVRIAGRDSVRIWGQKTGDFLVVVNGQPLSETEQKRMLSSDLCVYFFNRQQRANSICVYKDEDNKRPYIEQYGERAKNAIMVITTIPDTLCDAYVQQHPELKKERHHIEGYVYDENNKPLADTWVQVKDKGMGAATDSVGYFSIWLPQTDVELKASHIGYVTCVVKTIKPMLTIQLRSATTLREVKVRGKRNRDSLGAKAIPIKEINIKDYKGIYDE